MFHHNYTLCRHPCEAAVDDTILSADSNASGCVAMAHLEGWGALVQHPVEVHVVRKWVLIS